MVSMGQGAETIFLNELRPGGDDGSGEVHVRRRRAKRKKKKKRQINEK